MSSPVAAKARPAVSATDLAPAKMPPNLDPRLGLSDMLAIYKHLEKHEEHVVVSRLGPGTRAPGKVFRRHELHTH